MKYVYLFVEGNTDKALIEALLTKHYKLQNYKNRNDMPRLISRQVENYPRSNGDLERNGRAAFLYSDHICVMLEQVGGKNRFAQRIEKRLVTASLESVDDDEKLIVVVIQDRDYDTDEHRIEELRNSFNRNKIFWENDRISFKGEAYDFYEYCLPFDKNGAVEGVILEVARKIHPDLWAEAEHFRQSIKGEKYKKYRKEWAATEKHQELYADKVHVGAITAVLKPDSSPAMMIMDKLIIIDKLSDIQSIEEIQKLIDFLSGIIEG